MIVIIRHSFMLKNQKSVYKSDRKEVHLDSCSWEIQVKKKLFLPFYQVLLWRNLFDYSLKKKLVNKLSDSCQQWKRASISMEDSFLLFDKLQSTSKNSKFHYCIHSCGLKQNIKPRSDEWFQTRYFMNWLYILDYDLILYTG